MQLDFWSAVAAACGGKASGCHPSADRQRSEEQGGRAGNPAGEGATVDLPAQAARLSRELDTLGDLADALGVPVTQALALRDAGDRR